MFGNWYYQEENDRLRKTMETRTLGSPESSEGKIFIYFLSYLLFF